LKRSSGHRRRGTPHLIDIQVGSRVRQRRVQVGLSQTQLAEAVGTTYQQLQKYERGTNRIRASRLLEIALVLGVSISFFYGDADPPTPPPAEGDKLHELDPLVQPEAMELAAAAAAIPDPLIRRRLLDLARALGADSSAWRI
jgi:transcriptional regulator with XRE-family HTH domain